MDPCDRMEMNGLISTKPFDTKKFYGLMKQRA